LTLAAVTRYVAGTTASDVRKLRGAGLSSLRDIARASVGEVVDVTGIARENVERIRAFAMGAIVASTAREPEPLTPKRGGIPDGWMRVTLESDAFKGQLTFDYETFGKYLEPILSKLAESDEGAVISSSRATPRPTKKRSRRTTASLGSAT